MAGQVAQKAPVPLHPAPELPPHEQLLLAMRKEQEELEVRIQIVRGLADERDRALEQVAAIRELAERTMSEAEERDLALGELE
jgi:hypothetical protein